MEAPPWWRECDRFIYCRVNVAKALTAALLRFRAGVVGDHYLMAGDSDELFRRAAWVC
jgi:hypothetical protein